MNLCFFTILDMVLLYPGLTSIRIIKHSLVSAVDIKLPLCGTKEARIGGTRLKCSIMKWEKKVPYKLSEDLTDKLKYAIEDAIKTWNRIFQNCIEYTPHESESDFVTFHGGLLCHSFVGRKPGGQIITLDSLTCGTFGKIAHEMMHVIGFQHEHMRSDRDKYIKVNYESIPPDWHNEFRIVEENFQFNEIGPYDYYSLMHYRVLSPDSKGAAFEVLTKGIDEDRIGAQLNLTELDIMKIKKMYCPDQGRNLIPEGTEDRLLQKHHIPGEGYWMDMETPTPEEKVIHEFKFKRHIF